MLNENSLARDRTEISTITVWDFNRLNYKGGLKFRIYDLARCHLLAYNPSGLDNACENDHMLNAPC